MAAQRLIPPKRTEGDGMEITESKIETDLSNDLKHITKNLQTCNIINEEPHKGTPIISNQGHCLTNVKSKEPKFVPYEPYKAAVKPIIPKKKKNSTNKIRVTELVHMHRDKSKAAPMVTDHHTENETEQQFCNCKSSINLIKQLKIKEQRMEEEIKILKDENIQLEKQLKFYAQMNGELKNFLVSSMGEDMETKVNVLAEDKIHLAKALLTSAESLSTHKEQTEWLAGQCEVWRSKFLASSVMVEELAKWKAGLLQKVQETQTVLQKMKDEYKIIYDNNLKIFNNLRFLKENFDLISRRNDGKCRNLIDISLLNARISDILVLQLLGRENDLKHNCECYEPTCAEKLADQIIMNPYSIQLISDPDVACSAVVGAAVAVSSQMFLKTHPPSISCCAQCNGEIKLV